MLLRLALRELTRSWRFGLFFIFNLSLGLTGFISLQAFNSALESQIKMNSKSILSADISISARRELSDNELQKMRSIYPYGTQEGKVYEFFAMMNSSKGSRLVMVKAIDDSYPMYGEMELQSGTTITAESNKKNILQKGWTWIYPELKVQLGLSVGDEVQLGKLNLKIDDIIAKDATQTFRMAALAPRIFIHRSLLPESGLLQMGSTFSMAYLLKLPSDVSSQNLQGQFYRLLADPGITVDNPGTAGEDSGRQLGYLTDYLSLVSLVALFMSALGAAYVYRLFLSARMKEVAILRTLGLQSWQAVSVYVIQAAVLGVLATVPTILFSQMVLPFLSGLLASLSPFSLRPQLEFSSVVICFLMAVLGSFIVSLPFLIRILDLRASKLFSEERFSAGDSRFRLWPFFPGLLIFYFLSVYQSHSWRTGTYFVVSMFAVLLLLTILGWMTVKSSGLLKNQKRWFLRFSFLSLSRRARASLAVFVALGLGTLLINILPQLKNSLQAEFQIEGHSKIPSLFMFDIQDEQVQDLQQALSENKVSALGLSPLVRARIIKVNDQDYERKIENEGFKTREEEMEARFRNRGVNLSYRHELSSSEVLVEGRGFSGDFRPQQKWAELSVEKKFAERMGLKLGDKLLFDVQGVEVLGEIINLRKVKWTSFQPNFFILVQNGVLNEAPKTFIAAIPSLGQEKRAELQNKIVEKFPNVSVIDVVRAVDSVLAMAEKMSWTLELMAGLALITGYIVLFSIVRSQMKMRRWELNMLKILGASNSEVAGFIMAEFAFLAFLSASAGAFLSVLVSFFLSGFIFDSEFVLTWQQPLASVLIITFLSLIVAFLAGLDIVKESALSILREER